ncbi:MAG: MerR family transcriptional regulator [Candidatus Cloacimonadales bacterium]|nr:MerR family transcriptional regulator [Candidatus Cloacimonadales bacterium]
MSKFYYSIGEVCNLLDLKAHVLRYWEKEFVQVKPKKQLGRNRRYTPDDIDLLRKIKYMLYEQRFTIDGVRKKLKEEKVQPNQMELDFSVDKDEVKKNIIKELKEVKELLKGTSPQRQEDAKDTNFQ